MVPLARPTGIFCGHKPNAQPLTGGLMPPWAGPAEA
jgi:hypothetical protein